MFLFLGFLVPFKGQLLVRRLVLVRFDFGGDIEVLVALVELKFVLVLGQVGEHTHAVVHKVEGEGAQQDATA